jgi:FtsP/CotA-like multicopper oxidase with cupredoxin domain
MRTQVTRRAFVGCGIAAGLWAWPCGAGAQLAPLKEGPGGVLVLEAGPASLQLAAPPAPATALLGYNGAAPGPLLRVRQGEPLKLKLVNKLPQPTTLSFPGLRTANAVLGVGGLTQPPVAAGASQDIRFAPPDSGFNLYLPHAGAVSASQLSQGLFGPIIVEEPSPPAVDLEAVVILSDWRLDSNGGIADLGNSALDRGAGRIGSILAANSALAPLTLSAAPGARVRLRLANAATVRVMTIAIEGAKTLIVAVDGQPSETFEPLHNLVPVGPGARFELMFDMPREAGALARFALRGGDLGATPGEPDRPMLVIEAKGAAVAPRPPLGGLPANPRLPAEIGLERAKRADLTMTGGGGAPFAIDGVTFTDWAAKPSFAVPRGSPVTLGLVNKTANMQAFRLNGHVARLLHALDDGWEPYWRDTFLLQPGKTLHAAFVADNPGKWPIESASPERRSAGLATWFQVT